MGRVKFFRGNFPGFTGILLAIIIVIGCGGNVPPISPADQKVLLKVEDIEEFLREGSFDVSKGVISKDRIENNQIRLSYEYRYGGVYLMSTVVVAPDSGTARQYFFKSIDDMKFGYALTRNVSFENDNKFFRYGNQSQFFVIKQKGKTVGNALVILSGEKTFNMIVTGLNFDDPDIFSDIIMPKLASLRRYEP